MYSVIVVSGEDITRPAVRSSAEEGSADEILIQKAKTYIQAHYTRDLTREEVAELLATSIRIREISKRLGCQSRNRFFINVKQFSGYCPTEYRRQILCMEDPE